MDGVDLFALMSALGWLVDQPSFAPRADHLFHVIASAILTNRSSNDVKKATQRRSRDFRFVRAGPRHKGASAAGR
jgi:hypothetical protein